MSTIYIFFMFTSQVSLGQSVDQLIKEGVVAQTTVRFAFKDSDIGKQLYYPIKRMAQIYLNKKTDQGIRYEVYGHTCSVGSKKTNEDLSLARAKTVKKILGFYGVPEKLISVEGFGESRPIYDNLTEEGREKNRRIEIRVVGFASSSTKKNAEVTPPKNNYSKNLINGKVAKTNKSKGKTFLAKKVDSVEVTRSLSQEKESNTYRYYIGAYAFENIFLAENIKQVPSSDIDAEWVSEINLRLEGVYQWKLKQHFWVGFGAGFEQHRYRPEEDANFTWDEKGPWLWDISLDTQYEKNRLVLGTKLNVYEQIFLEEENFNIELDKDLMIGAGAFAHFIWLRHSDFRLRLELALDYPIVAFSNSNRRGQVGGVVGLGVTLNKVLKKQDLDFLINFGQLGVQNSKNSQDETFVGIGVRLRTKNWM